MEKTVHRKMITEVTGLIPDTTLWEYEDYANTFRIDAIAYVFDSDDIETHPSELTEAQEHDIAEDVIVFLFANNARWYRALLDNKITSEDAGSEYAAIRSGHGGWLLSDELTAHAKSYGDFNIL